MQQGRNIWTLRVVGEATAVSPDGDSRASRRNVVDFKPLLI